MARLLVCLTAIVAPVVAPVQGQSAGGHRSLGEQLGRGRLVLREIRFAPRSDRMDPASDFVLRELARALAASPGVFLIEGHTDAMRDAVLAQHLSEQRAVAVKTRLVSEGVAAGRLLAVGYGAARPAPRGNRHNARIEVARLQ
jgi:outer membrane protein OmpA-like peptidoglycan-associated protein